MELPWAVKRVSAYKNALSRECGTSRHTCGQYLLVNKVARAVVTTVNKVCSACLLNVYNTSGINCLCKYRRAREEKTVVEYKRRGEWMDARTLRWLRQNCQAQSHTLVSNSVSIKLKRTIWNLNTGVCNGTPSYRCVCHDISPVSKDTCKPMMASHIFHNQGSSALVHILRYRHEDMWFALQNTIKTVHWTWYLHTGRCAVISSLDAVTTPYSVPW